MNRLPEYMAANATVVGQTEFAQGTSVWFNTVIRADEDRIQIREGTNIQDSCVLHTDTGDGMNIGSHVSVGHGTILHGCTIEDGALIGMGSIILNHARIGRNSMIGAGSLVTGGTVIPEGVLAMGSPARVIRPLRPEEIEANLHNAAEYEKAASRELEKTAAASQD